MSRSVSAAIGAKAYAYGALNPMAHRQNGFTAAEVLESRLVVDPITSLMSSPVSDGAAAVIVSSAPGSGPCIRIVGSRLASRPPQGVDGPSSARSATTAAFHLFREFAPDEIDVAEVHDASVAYEAIAWTETGLCVVGDELAWALSGRQPARRTAARQSIGRALISPVYACPGASGLARASRAGAPPAR